MSNESHGTRLLKLMGDINKPYAKRLKLTKSISSSPSPESMPLTPAAKSIAPTTIRDTAVSTQVLSASSNHGTPSAQILSHSIPAPRNSSSATPSRTTVSLANSPERGMRDSSVYSSPSKKRPFAGLAWKPSKRSAKDVATLSSSVSHATVALKDCMTVVAESLRKEILLMTKTAEQILQISEAAREQALASCSHFDASSQCLQISVRNAVQEESKKLQIVLDANLRSIRDEIVQEIGLLRAQQENVPARR